MKLNLLLFYLLVSGLHLPVFPCTVFYATDGNNILFGNNEDWSDPKTRMWFIASKDGKHGWVKFGFAGGYPQGGMNEYGLCWDAIACPYLAMPYSEANKQKYAGPLMKKVMEECATMEEASAVFANYYCDDQYRAQYLLGDTRGASMIVEGDSAIVKTNQHQVLTNFYQSHPELGGYPCWRFETAKTMLANSNEISPYFCGSILSATHQKGRYPTQYSGIYDLKQGIIYLFYYHNFKEFLTIDVKAELDRGSRSYDLPQLFSKIQLISPEVGEMVNPAAVTFRWEGKSSSHYDLYYSTDPDFTKCTRVPVKSPHSPNLNVPYFGTILVVMAIAASVRHKKRKLYILMTMIGMIFFVNIQCKDKVTSRDLYSDTTEISITVDNLAPNTAYYWKITAQSESTEDFSTESIDQNFVTSN
jgi:hypothetical protein